MDTEVSVCSYYNKEGEDACTDRLAAIHARIDTFIDENRRIQAPKGRDIVWYIVRKLNLRQGVDNATVAQYIDTLVRSGVVMAESRKGTKTTGLVKPMGIPKSIQAQSPRTEFTRGAAKSFYSPLKGCSTEPQAGPVIVSYVETKQPSKDAHASVKLSHLEQVNMALAMLQSYSARHGSDGSLPGIGSVTEYLQDIFDCSAHHATYINQALTRLGFRTSVKDGWTGYKHFINMKAQPATQEELTAVYRKPSKAFKPKIEPVETVLDEAEEAVSCDPMVSCSPPESAPELSQADSPASDEGVIAALSDIIEMLEAQQLRSDKTIKNLLAENEALRKQLKVHEDREAKAAKLNPNTVRILNKYSEDLPR